MAPELPGTEIILGDFLRLEPHTPEGQWKAAKRVAELVEKHGLGVAEILEYPITHDNGDRKNFPMVKITSEFGVDNPNRPRKNMAWLGHLDTVQPTAEQEKRDPLILVENGSADAPRTLGKGRGTGDMWGGNVAMLMALNTLKNLSPPYAIETYMPSREEDGSEVLWQAIQNGDVAPATVGLTTEIRVNDDGKTSPPYRARTGRIGMKLSFKGEGPHLGKCSSDINALRTLAFIRMCEAMHEVTHRTDERAFLIHNSHPDDTLGILPQVSRVVPVFPKHCRGVALGLSGDRLIEINLHMFHSDPGLAPERARAKLAEYLSTLEIKEPDSASYMLEEGKHFELKLENRHGVDFTSPYLTPHDHPLAIRAEKEGKRVDNQKKQSTVAGEGVAEDGVLAAQLDITMVGKSPVCKYAHEDGEFVEMESIGRTAEWLVGMATPDEHYE